MNGTNTHRIQRTAQSRAPYRPGERVDITAPDGQRYVARVETVTRTSNGAYLLDAAVVAPRKFRAHLITVRVDADGVSDLVRPA